MVCLDLSFLYSIQRILCSNGILPYCASMGEHTDL